MTMSAIEALREKLNTEIDFAKEAGCAVRLTLGDDEAAILKKLLSPFREARATPTPRGELPKDRCDFCDNGIEPDWAFCPHCSRALDLNQVADRACLAVPNPSRAEG
jgi:hypothetical protein